MICKGYVINKVARKIQSFPSAQRIRGGSLGWYLRPSAIWHQELPGLSLKPYLPPPSHPQGLPFCWGFLTVADSLFCLSQEPLSLLEGKEWLPDILGAAP
jgi:hypothetical protein